MLRTIEKVTRQAVEPMQLPSAKIINEQRINAFKQKITDVMANRDLGMFEKVVAEYQLETGAEPVQIAAALAQLAQGREPLLVAEKEPKPQADDHGARRRSRNKAPDAEPLPLKEFPDIEMCRYRIEVGHRDDVKPGNIVGAIANEADLESQYIGSIDIYEDFSTVDLPSGMPKEIFHDLRKARVCGKKLDISEFKQGKQKKTPQKHKNRAKSAKRKASGKRFPDDRKKQTRRRKQAKQNSRNKRKSAD
jgi:ATP-dependent RNA helicase DeaD